MESISESVFLLTRIEVPVNAADIVVGSLALVDFIGSVVLGLVELTLLSPAVKLFRVVTAPENGLEELKLAIDVACIAMEVDFIRVDCMVDDSMVFGSVAVDSIAVDSMAVVFMVVAVRSKTLVVSCWFTLASVIVAELVKAEMSESFLDCLVVVGSDADVIVASVVVVCTMELIESEEVLAKSVVWIDVSTVNDVSCPAITEAVICDVVGEEFRLIISATVGVIAVVEWAP